jgi:acetyl-CoA C-acetyltransferase
VTPERAIIAGIYEDPRRSIPEGSVYEIKANAARLALEDAGLGWQDVDGLYDSGEPDPGMPGIGLPEYFGMHPSVVDTTSVGGAGYEFLAAHAAEDIRAGRVNVALITYGSVLRRQSRSGGLSIPDLATPVANLERPYGLSLVGNYALSAMRHSYEFGTTAEQLAAIAVTTRRHALLNPVAVDGLHQIGFKDVGELSVEKVMTSRKISDPLHVYDCCLVTDGGGAIVIVSSAVAKGIRKPGVEILGSGEAVRYLHGDNTITSTAAAESAPRAFAQAGVSAADVDVAMLYDSFTITVLMLLEDLGFCKKGEGGPYAASGVLAFDQPGGPAVNTDGGGLSSTHPGMRGIFLLIEAVRQLRGESTAQVPDAEIAVAHGNGGYVATRHSGATIVLGRQR